MNRFRIGFGYDTHRFAENRKLVIGGVEISHPKGLLGHSDADVLLHAICDALLGAAGLRDIGYHFPDTDPAFKNIDSKILIRQTWNLVKSKGFQFGNLDCTLVAEAPKINPHIEAMKLCIASLLETEIGNIGIKATTNEKMGAIGREEGIAAYAVTLLFS